MERCSQKLRRLQSQHQATMHDKSHCYFSLQMACVAKSDEGCRLRKPKFWQNAVRVIGQNAHSPQVSRTQRTSWLLRGGSAAAAPRFSLGSGARAAARRRAAVRFCGDGCCAAAVPLPRLAASHQRRSSRGALWHEALRARGGNCCAAAVPPPCLAAPRQRRSSRCAGKEPCSLAAMAAALRQCQYSHGILY